MTHLKLVTCIILLTIANLSIFSFSRVRQQHSQRTTQTNAAIISPSVSVSIKTMDDYISYSVPANWGKKLSAPAEDTYSLQLTSPNFRSTFDYENREGLQITIVRVKLPDNMTPKEKILTDSNPYIDKKNIKLIPITVDNQQGYIIPSVYEWAYPGLAITKNRYQYSVLFIGAKGNEQQQIADEFIKSIRFQ